LSGITQQLQRDLLIEEIRRIVADAGAAGETLHTDDHATKLFDAYPAAGFSIGRIVDELTLAAGRARVPVEIARPE
jgi:hypothetical protein